MCMTLILRLEWATLKCQYVNQQANHDFLYKDKSTRQEEAYKIQLPNERYYDDKAVRVDDHEMIMKFQKSTTAIGKEK